MKVAAVKKPGGPRNLIIEERAAPVAGPAGIAFHSHATEKIQVQNK